MSSKGNGLIRRGVVVATPTTPTTPPAVPVRKVRMRRGSLKLMPGMPLDIVLEILKCMHPQDLLNLARTNRDFRSCLMSRSNQIIWKEARQNVEGLPECPFYMSEPAYANVAFMRYCHLCFKPAISDMRIFVHIPARYCTKCESEMLVEEEDKEVLDLAAEVKSATDKELPLPTRGPVPKYHRASLAKFREEWAKLSDAEARKNFVEEQSEIVMRIEEFSSKFYTWRHKETSRRKDELKLVQTRRMEEILRRLRDEGHGEELDYFSPTMLRRELKKQSWAKKNAELTDHAWNTIWSNASDWVEKMRGIRLCDVRYAREEVMSPRFALLRDFIKASAADCWPDIDDEDAHGPMPRKSMNYVDFALMDDVRAVLDVPESVRVTEASISCALKVPLKELVIKWFQKRKWELIDMLQDHTGGEQWAHEDALSLATSLFDCVKCSRQFIPYPEVLAHRCKIVQWNAPTSEAMATDYSQLASTFFGQGWDPRLVSVNERVFPYKARALLQACKMDPETATQRDMDKCGKRMTCGTCTSWRANRGQGYEVFDWRRALLHQDSEMHYESASPCEWVILPEQIAFAVRNFEKKEMEAGRSFLSQVWSYRCCRQDCGETFKIQCKQALIAHLASRHGVENDDVKQGVQYEKVSKRMKFCSPQGVYLYNLMSGEVEVSFEKQSHADERRAKATSLYSS